MLRSLAAVALCLGSVNAVTQHSLKLQIYQTGTFTALESFPGSGTDCSWAGGGICEVRPSTTFDISVQLEEVGHLTGITGWSYGICVDDVNAGGHGWFEPDAWRAGGAWSTMDDGRNPWTGAPALLDKNNGSPLFINNQNIYAGSGTPGAFGATQEVTICDTGCPPANVLPFLSQNIELGRLTVRVSSMIGVL